MVARAHDRVRETNDPTAHAVVVRPPRGRPPAGYGAARRCHGLRDARALRDVRRGPADQRRHRARLRRPERAPTARPGPSSSSPSTRRSRVASRSSAGSAAPRPRSSSTERPTPSDARSGLVGASSGPSAEGARPAASGILSRGEVSEWLMVPLSKSGVRKHRGFESRPLRQASGRGVAEPTSDLGSSARPR